MEHIFYVRPLPRSGKGARKKTILFSDFTKPAF